MLPYRRRDFLKPQHTHAAVANRTINYRLSVQVLSTVPLVTTHEQSASAQAYEQYGTGDTWRDESNIALQ
jgi:hypothetical protein